MIFTSDEEDHIDEEIINYLTDPSREIPPFILLYPLNDSYVKTGFLKQEWMLKLCCMYPGNEHVLEGTGNDKEDTSNKALGWYVLADYGERVAPLIKLVKRNERTLKLAFPHLGNLLAWLHSNQVTEFIESQSRKIKTVSFPGNHLSVEGEKVTSKVSGIVSLPGLDDRQYYRFEGQELIFLDEIIKTQGRCGNLHPFFYHGNWLWLCKEHKEILDKRHKTEKRSFKKLLAAYHEWARDEYGQVEMIGIGGKDAAPSAFLSLLYIPLILAVRQMDFHSNHQTPLNAQSIVMTEDNYINQDQIFTVDVNRGLVIFGDPGSGKTTFLKWLIWKLAEGEEHSLKGLPLDITPILLNLREFNKDLLNISIDKTIQKQLDHQTGGRFPFPFVEHLWQRGKVLLLLDGLDEIRDEAFRRSVCDYINHQLAGLKGKNIRCIISCRYSGYGGDNLLGARFTFLDILPLTSAQIEIFIRNWFKAAERIKQALQAKHAVADLIAERKAQELVDRVNEIARTDRDLTQVISSPLLLALLCLVAFRRGEIPWRRSEFYKACLEILLGNWITNKGMQPCLQDQSEALLILSRVAYELYKASRVHDMRKGEFEQLAGERLRMLSSHLGSYPTAENIFKWFHEDAGVIARFGQDSYGLLHKSFQEYLAALEVGRVRKRLLRSLARRISDEWWAPVIMFLLDDPQHAIFDEFIKEVIRTTKGQVAEYFDFLRRCLLTSKEARWDAFKPVLNDDKIAPRHKTAVCKLFVESRDPEFLKSVAIYADHPDPELSDVARWIVRAAKGSVLAPVPTDTDNAPFILGSLLTEGDFFEPRTIMRMLYVPEGVFPMGADDMSADESPCHLVQVSRFWIGETQVTNNQYGQFLRDTGFEEPKFWRVLKYIDPEMPVVGVSWYAAKAFCSWLARESGLPFHLPAEAQWEYAAKGPGERKYPWGDDPPDTSRALFASSERDLPMPVRTFPLGKGPFGTYDQAGNVYEWCLDEWDEKAYKNRARSEKLIRDPISINPSSSQRALRGGGWISVQRYLRTAFRGRQHASSQYDYLGFRVVISQLKGVQE